jgi:PPK2 family polyphosphate:nucleotide phosphotransferase
MAKIDRYRVKSGSKFKLTDHDPSDRSERSKEGKEADAERLAKLGARLDELQDVLYAESKHKILIVLQGMDTSGKDGTIRHVFNSVDPLGVRVASFKAPTPEELSHDYLWRVHRQCPAAGEIVVFNRSHYEDVLIVRVRGWITKAQCEQRYRHINEFERMLTESGTTILKCFLHISKDEQKLRLQERLDDKEKNWKFNTGDLEERKLWPNYMDAYERAIRATSTEHGPWHVIPANSKTNRNLAISHLLVDTLESLKLKHPKPAPGLDKITVK